MAVAADSRISIIIPALNEAGSIETTLHALQAFRHAGHEVIVVDGGSTDATVARAAPLADTVFRAPAGRASQLQAGAGRAGGTVFWFLHADTRVPDTAARAILDALGTGRPQWGFFAIRFPEPVWSLRVVAWMINHRSRLTGIATGDQGIFVTRALFRQVSGFAPLPLMEDIALSRRLKRHTAPACLALPLTTSSRRWRRHGIVRTILLMWLLRFAWFIGVPSRLLVRLYPPHSP